MLEVNYVKKQELHLHGRGLHLIPSYFCYDTTVSFADPGLTLILIYPVERDLRWAAGAAADRRSLEALLGRTRTAVLYAADAGVTTTQLSRLLDISPSSASRHSTVLRDAGLIATHRCGRAVLHTLTTLGRQLISQAAPPRFGQQPQPLHQLTDHQQHPEAVPDPVFTPR